MKAESTEATVPFRMKKLIIKLYGVLLFHYKEAVVYVRSAWFNYKYLDRQIAKYIPIRIDSAVEVQSLKRGNIIINQPHRYCIKMGSEGSPGYYSNKSVIRVDSESRIVFGGRAILGRGVVLRCEGTSKLQFGDLFYCNNNCYFRCADDVLIGDDCMMGWDNVFNTTDGHEVFVDGKLLNNHGPISIGNHVWITSRCTINKSVTISDNCIIAASSVVTKSFDEPNLLIGGVPARRIKCGVVWKR